MRDPDDRMNLTIWERKEGDAIDDSVFLFHSLEKALFRVRACHEHARTFAARRTPDEPANLSPTVTRYVSASVVHLQCRYGGRGPARACEGSCRCALNMRAGVRGRDAWFNEGSHEQTGALSAEVRGTSGLRKREKRKKKVTRTVDGGREWKREGGRTASVVLHLPECATVHATSFRNSRIL